MCLEHDFAVHDVLCNTFAACSLDHTLKLIAPGLRVAESHLL